MLGEILRIVFERQHMGFDKRPRARPQILDLGRKSKIHAGAPG